jgi:endo-1,4-beta-xylanase
MHSWIVVNEAVNVADGRSDGLRDTNVSSVLSDSGWGKYPTWLSFLGSDYIDLAFRTAAKADPQAMLLYNDDRLCYDLPEHETQRVEVLQLLKSLKAKKTPNFLMHKNLVIF